MDDVFSCSHDITRKASFPEKKVLKEPLTLIACNVIECSGNLPIPMSTSLDTRITGGTAQLQSGEIKF